MDLALRIFAVVVPTLVVLAGLGVLWYGLRLRDRSRQLRRIGTVTMGRIVDNRVEAQGSGHVGFLPVIRFKPAGGQPQTLVGRVRRSTAYPTGTQVQVCYDPEEPARAVLVGRDGSGQYLVGGLAIAVFGLVMALIIFLVAGR